MERKKKSKQVIAPKTDVYHNPTALTEFMEQPKIKIAEAITGALASEKKEIVLALGRIVQGVLKGDAISQLGREINELSERGKIKEDYADGKYGLKSLADILAAIDNEVPDEDKFHAIKALFYSINATDVEREKELLNYQLFQIALSLTSSELLTLRACYKLKDTETYKGDGIVGAGQWLHEVAWEAGHKSTSIIERDEDVLMSKKIISPRKHVDQSGIHKINCRLTDIGVMIGENLTKYDFSVNLESESAKNADIEKSEDEKK